MTKTIRTLAALGALAGAASLVAQEAATSELSISTTMAFESEYVFRGQSLAAESFQPSVELGYGGFYAGVWANLPADDASNGTSYDNEIDYYAGYNFAVTDLISLDVGFTYFDYPETVPAMGSGEDQQEVYLGAAFDTILSPAVYLYYEFEYEIITIEASIGHSFEVAENTSVDVSAYLGWQDYDVATGNEDGYYAGASVDLVYAFTDNASASFGGRISTVDIDPSMPMGGADEDNAWWGASFTAGF